MPLLSAAKPKELARNSLLCISMFILIFGDIAYAVVRDIILEDRYGKHNLVAHTNLYEESIIVLVVLVAPFIGGCSAFRLTRSANRSTKICGWFALVVFSIGFLQAATISWSQYHKYMWNLRM